MMTSFDAAELISDADQETMNDHFRNARYYSPLPHLHWTTFLNTVLIVALPGMTTVSEIVQVLELGKATGVIVAKVQPGVGSTEAGAYFIQIRKDDDDCEYYQFRPRSELKRWQQVFVIYPDVDEFQTKDLWTKHPSKSDLWRYVGRTDDLVILSNGLNIEPSAMEAAVQRSPNVRVALIRGQGRPRPFALVERVDDASDIGGGTGEALVVVERANKGCAESVRVGNEMVLFAKATVARQRSFELYEEELEGLY
ncbi:MAG: hypothetical protein Q9213_001552 [Squamulea squamosa]